jgi:hypothetical protein
MTGVEFLTTMITEFHGALMEDMKPQTPQNLKWKPGASGQSHWFSLLALHAY